MSLMKLFWKKGFSLPEVTVAMGLLGGVSLITMQLMEEQAANEALIRSNVDLSKTVSVLQAAINNARTCMGLFGNKTRSALPGTAYDRIEYPVTGGMKVLLEEGPYTDFYIGDGDIRLATSTMGTNVTDVIINFRLRAKPKDNIINAADKVVTKRISMVTSFTDAGTTIKSCGPVLQDANSAALEKLCNSLNVNSTAPIASWNGTNCVFTSPPTFKCPWGQVPNEVSSLGRVICVPTDFQVTPSQIFNFGSSNCSGGGGNIQVYESGGRISVRCY